MDHIAFERLDDENLVMALGAYTCFPDACKAHMMKTAVFNWKLRTFPPFLKAFPKDSAELNAHFDKINSATRQIPPSREKTHDTVLTHEEWTLLKTAEGHELLPVLDKIAADPKYDDVLALLTFSRRTYNSGLIEAYTPEVHAKLVALKEPLKALIHDVDDKNKAVVEPPVRAIGMELHALGGFKAQQAVYYAMQGLLYDEQSWCSDGPWSNAGSALTLAWDGCGQWVA